MAASNEYLKTSVMTASPEMLTLMLWDGAIRFAEQGREAILKKDIEGSFKALVRSQKIITELTANLRHEVNPDLCGKLAGLYNFIYRLLVDANISREVKQVNDALDLMKHQRQTWVMLMDKLSKERAGDAQRTVAANADSVASAEMTVASVPQAANAKKRAYPAFAVRPGAGASTLSVQG